MGQWFGGPCKIPKNVTYIGHKIKLIYKKQLYIAAHLFICMLKVVLYV